MKKKVAPLERNLLNPAQIPPPTHTHTHSNRVPTFDLQNLPYPPRHTGLGGGGS